jgi:hypothetical protein
MTAIHCYHIIHTSTTGAKMVYKYTIHARMKTPQRGVSLTIKTENDWDVSDKLGQLGFLGAHHVMEAVEKVFGEGSVQECTVMEKTLVLSQA